MLGGMTKRLLKSGGHILSISIRVGILIGGPDIPVLARPASTHTDPILFTVKLLTPGSASTGFIVGRKRATYRVVTTSHSVEHISQDEELAIVTHDGAKHSGKVLQTLKDVDFAVVSFASSNNYQLGSLAYSPVKGKTLRLTGYKDDDQSVIDLRCPVVTEGSNIDARPGGYLIVYRCNTTPGMSGSPLTNTHSEIVGMHGQADVYHDLLGGGVWKSGNSLGVPANLIRDRLEITQGSDKKNRNSYHADDYYLSSTYKASLGYGIGALRDINLAIDGSKSPSLEHLEHRTYLHIMLGMYEEAGKDAYSIASRFPDVYLGEWLISLLAFHATKDVESVLALGAETNKLPPNSFRRVTGFYWAYIGASRIGLINQANEYKRLMCRASNAVNYRDERCA